MNRRILLVEDSPENMELLQDALRSLRGCPVEKAANESDAIRWIDRALFPLVITDIDLSAGGGSPDAEGGFRVLEAAKHRDPATQVLVVTHHPQPEHIHRIRARGGFAYIDRTSGYWQDLLHYEARDALQEYEQARKGSRVTLTLSDLRGDRLEIALGGTDVYPRKMNGPLTLERDLMVEVAAGIGSLYPNGDLKQCNSLAHFTGRYLWEKLFADHEEAVLAFGEALGRTSYASHVHLRMAGGPDMLDVPFELLHDRTGYLALRHPLVRMVPDARPKARAWPDLLEDLNRHSEPLRVLLIAANVEGDFLGGIPNVDLEIEAIAAVFRSLGHEPTLVPSAMATCDRVKARLREHWDVVHYAGHGSYDPANPQNSGIYLWGGDRPGAAAVRSADYTRSPCRPARVATQEIKNCVEPHAPTLFYLSCCHSARTSGSEAFTYSKSLGLMHALVDAGIPAVLGHRWPLRDDSMTIAFVEKFYTDLLSERPPEEALLSARRSMQEKDDLDPTWSSAVMVSQETR